MLIAFQIVLLLICLVFGLSSLSDRKEHRHLISRCITVFTVATTALVVTFLI
jgi:hypothetical protein